MSSYCLRNGKILPRAAGCAAPVATTRFVFQLSGSGVTPTTRFFATTRYTPAIIGHQRSPILSRKCNRCMKPPLRNEGFMQRLHFLDKMGDRWGAMMAGVDLV